MKLAFYYHIPVFKTDKNALYLPGYLGIFVDALALEVEILVLIMHTSSNSDNADYQLKSKNIRLIDGKPLIDSAESTFSQFLSSIGVSWDRIMGIQSLDDDWY